VSTRRLIALIAAAAALVVVLVVGTGLGWWSGQSGPAPAKPIAVRTFLEPTPAFFGDAVVAQIDVQIDPARVGAKSVRVVPAFDPLVVAGAPEVSRIHAGGREVLRYRYTIECLTEDCLPSRKQPFAVKLKPFVVTATAGGRRVQVNATWPKTSVLTRLQQGDIGTATPNFRRPETMPPPSYAVSPNLAADLLTAAAALLALVAVALVGREAARLLERRRRRGVVELTPLEEALAYTRDAAGRPEADRRKALELLARTLEDEGAPGLADTAGDVAWAEEPPSPDRAIELADEVEGATRNGR